MKKIRRILKSLGRHVTVMVIPHNELPQLSGRFSIAFLLFSIILWSGLTIWAGFLAGRHVDYWITKTDNLVIRTRMKYLVEEIDKSQEMLKMASATDKQMRILLGMGSRDEILKGKEAIGGPSPSDRLVVGRGLESGHAQPSQRIIRRSVESIRRESERRLASFQEIAWYISNQRSVLKSTPDIWPTDGRLTSSFGYRFSPVGVQNDIHSNQFHEGVDIANSPDTPIVATAEGVVRYSGWSSGYGMMVLIDHGLSFSTAYAHTSKATVRVGDRVDRGQLIAYMGTTGRSTGHHLHYEVWRHGKPVNPMKYLRGRSGAGFASAR